MKQLQDLLNWLDSFEKLPFEPTRQNVVEKIWQLQSEIKREQLPIHNVVQQSEQLVCKGKCDHGYKDENGNELFCSIKKAN